MTDDQLEALMQSMSISALEFAMNSLNDGASIEQFRKNFEEAKLATSIATVEEVVEFYAEMLKRRK